MFTKLSRMLATAYVKPMETHPTLGIPIFQNSPSSSISNGRSVTNRPLVFGLRLFKTYDGESLTAQEFREKGIQWEVWGYNLFSVGQFCDSDLEVAFRKHSCYVRDTDGVELLKGSRGSNLYTISVEDMMKSSPRFCLLSKASKNKSWLWHRRLNHLNFGTINDFTSKDLALRLTRLKFEKDLLWFLEGLQNLQNKRDPTNNGDYSCYVRMTDSRKMAPYQYSSGTRSIRVDALDLHIQARTKSRSPAIKIQVAPPTNKDLEMLFQPMFDEYFNPPGIRQNPIPVIPTAGEPSAEVNPFCCS
ncbi:integrase, catalytic region, zinc finger, CCHC-type containing protein [Tanacetum coccineum]